MLNSVEMTATEVREEVLREIECAISYAWEFDREEVASCLMALRRKVYRINQPDAKER